MNLFAGSALSLALLLLGSTTVHAGECTYSDDEYLRTLELGARDTPTDSLPTSTQVSYALSCLTYNSINVWRWAGPGTAHYFASLHGSPLLPRIVAACKPYLLGRTRCEDEEGKDNLAFQAACTLAMFGVSEAAGQDIFEILANGNPADRMQLPYFALASLGDPRTLPLLRASSDSLCVAAQSHDNQYHKTQLVNCLYHLRGDSILSFVRVIAASDPDSAVVERAKHVLEARQP